MKNLIWIDLIELFAHSLNFQLKNCTYKNVIQLDFINSLFYIEALQGAEEEVEGPHDGYIAFWRLNVEKSLRIHQEKSHLQHVMH